MSRKNPSFENQLELNELITRYEEHLKNEESIYLDAGELADIADKYAEERKFEEAQQVIDYGLRLHPNNTELLIEQSLLYLDTQYLEKAKQVAYSITESSDEVAMLQAELLLNDEKPEEAEELFQRIKDTENYELMTDIACLYKDTGFPEKALPWIEEALDHFNDSEELWAMKAECHGWLMQTDEATEILNKLLDNDPYNAEYWTELAKCYFTANDLEKSLNAIDFALAADDQKGDAYAMKGHICFTNGEIEKAVEAYNRAIELKSIPKLLANMCIGIGYIGIQEWAKAEEALLKAQNAFMVDDPIGAMVADIYNQRALALVHLNRTEEALELCEKAKNVDQKDAESHFMTGYVYLHAGETSKAWSEWEQGLKLDSSIEQWIRVAEYFLEFNMLDETLFCLQEGASYFPENKDVQTRIAIVNLLMGDEEGFHTANSLSDNPVDINLLFEYLDQGDFNRKGYKGFWKLIDKFRQEGQ